MLATAAGSRGISHSASQDWAPVTLETDETTPIGAAKRILKAFSIGMNRRDDKKHSPARVYAQFTSVDEKESAIGANSGCKHEGSLGNRREIQITESGEVSHPPDKARVSIVCTNAKVRTHR